MLGYELKTAVGTSVFIMTFTALTGAVSHFTIGGAPDWTVFIFCVLSVSYTHLRGNGGTININEMEAMLGIPVVPISAAKNEGVDELVDHAIHVAKYQERPGRMDFCGEDDHGGAVHRCIHGIIHLIEDHARAAGIPVRFAATKLVEGDLSLIHI